MPFTRSVIISFIVSFALAGAAHAQQALQGDELKTFVSGKTLGFGSDGTASYKTDGKYEYSASNGNTYRGKWSIQGDRVCVDFDAGMKRCDQLFREGSNVVLQNSQGKKFPVAVK